MSVQPVRRRSTRPARLLAALAVGGLLLISAALPAAAKEFLNARLEAPISFDSPPGSELLVAVIVTVPDGMNDDPVEGSPIWLRLTGPTGDVTEAPGVMGSGPGRYEMRIRVPEGGPRSLEVMIRGSSDLPIFLMEDPFTFRPIGVGTAQLAPPRVTITPVPRVAASAIPVMPAMPAAPATDPAAAPATPPAPAPWPAIALGLAAGIVVAAGLALAMRRSRSASPAPSTIDAPRAPGA